MSYEPIPDVELQHKSHKDDGEALDVQTPTDVIIARAQAKYPEAGSSVEAEFLGRLDDAIEKARPHITLPRITAEKLKSMKLSSSSVGSDSQAVLGDVCGEGETQISGTNELFDAIKLPTVAFGVTIASALILMVVHSPVAKAMYPYYSCVVTYLASVPEIRKRFITTVRPLLITIQGQKQVVEQNVDGVATRGLNYLRTAEDACERALQPIRSKLQFANQAESFLRQVDPNIDIPTTDDIEKSFDGYESKLKTSFEGIQDVVDFSKCLPVPLQSVEKYQIYIMTPFLCIMLGLQLYGVYVTARTMTSHEEDTSAAAARFLMADEGSDDGAALNGTTLSPVSMTASPSFAPSFPPSTTTEYNEHELSDIWIAIQTYIATVVQIVIAFLLTQVRTMAAFLNSQISIMEGNINKQLEEQVGDIFEETFHKGFNAIRDKFLILVRKLDKLEGPINQVKNKVPGGDLGKVAVGFQSAGGSLLGRFGKK